MEFKTGDWGLAPKQERSTNGFADSVSVRDYLPDSPPSEELSFMTPFSAYVEEAPEPQVAEEKPTHLIEPEAPVPTVRPDPSIYSFVLKDQEKDEGLAPFSPDSPSESEILKAVTRAPDRAPTAEIAAEIDPPKRKAANHPAESDAPKGKSTGYPGAREAFRNKTPGYAVESELPKGKSSGYARGGRGFSSKTLEYANESEAPRGKSAGYPPASEAFRGKAIETPVELEVPEDEQPGAARDLESSKAKLQMFAEYSGFAVEELLEAVLEPGTALGTAKSRTSLQQPLTLEETDRLARIARIYEVAVKVYGDSADGRKWLTGKKRRYEDQTALSMLKTEAGERAVRQFLIQIDEGMFV